MTHATQPSDMAGDPMPVIRNHELRLRKTEETLSFLAGNLTGKPAFTQAMVEGIIATKHSVFQLPSDEKAEDSVRPLPGAGPEIASMVKEINENPLNAMCDKEGQTENIRKEYSDYADVLRYSVLPENMNPLKKHDRPTREQVEIAIAGWNPPYSAPAEPAPGSDAEHPPLGYRLAKVAEKREPGYVFWDGEGWIEGESTLFGSPVDPWHSSPCANPITANEGDSQKAGLPDKIAESVVQDLQQACYDRDELRATVERLTAELETTKRLLAESLVERDRLKNLHDARKVRIEGFRDVLRERLGDLV